ncbi:MAG: hypothetical protein SPF66_06025 [Bacteroidaceae bacterium]|nr:hypothetical protein [Bacteroidaceae bacterium]
MAQMKNSPFGLCNLSPWFVGGAAQEVPCDFSIKARQTSQNSRFFPPSTHKKQLGGDSEGDKNRNVGGMRGRMMEFAGRPGEECTDRLSGLPGPQHITISP